MEHKDPTLRDKENILLKELIVEWDGIKGTVSRDNAFYFKVYKFKSVLSVRPLMVLKLIYFVVL
jgi:hypothetical protein